MRTRSQRSSSVRRYAAPLDSVAGESAVLKPIGRGVWAQAWTAAGSPARTTLRQRWLVLGAALLAAFTLTLAALAWVDRPREADLSDLIAALPHPRPFVARLSGGFPYAPCGRAPEAEDGIPHLFCETPPRTQEEQARLRVLQDDFSRYARHQPEARQRHLAALWTLAVEGTRGNLDRAIEDLEAASKLEPENGAILSDLAVAFTARAAKTDDARDLVRALDAAERAAQASPELPEAQWNRAVAREVFVRRPALAAWRLVAEASGDWRAEASAAIERLDQPTMHEQWERLKPKLVEAVAQHDLEHAREIVARFPEEARAWIEATVLPEWATAVEHGDLHTSARLLTQAIAFSALLAKVSGDSLFLRGTQAAEQSQHQGLGSAAVQALANGHRKWAEGLAAFDRADYETASVAFLGARADLSQGGSPLAAWVEYLTLRCAYRSGDYVRVLKETEQLLSREQDLESPALLGRLAWVRGSAQAAIGQASDAAQWYDHALRNLEKATDSASQAALHVRSASAQADLGELLSAWRHRLLALRGFFSREDASEFPTALAESIFGARELGDLHAALALQDEEISRARAQSTSLALLLALRHRADLLSELDPAEAEAAIAAASRDARHIPSDSLRHFALHQIDLVHARLVRKADPERCIELLDGIEEAFRAAAPSMLPQALYERALCHRALGDTIAAETDLRAALAEVETLFRMRGVPQERAALVAGLRPIYDEMIAVQLERGNDAEALLFADRVRARALLEWILRLPQEGDPGDLLEVSPPLPERAIDLQSGLPMTGAFVEYHLAARELLAWVVRAGSLELIRTPAEPRAVAELVTSLREGTVELSSHGAPELFLLFDLLIRPLLPYLEPGETLHLIPDASLQAVPFAALLNRATGRFLIEDHPLVFVPSLATYQCGHRRAQAKHLDWSSALIVANPSFDRKVFPHLQPLSGAEREGESLSRLLTGSQLLRPKDATVGALLTAAGHHALVHVAAHAVASRSNPLRSYLVLAPDQETGDSGSLYGSHLLSADLSSTRLVVLAACESAGDPSGEGVAGLAWPLLARGVPQVLAATRSVQDHSTFRLFENFYHFLVQGDEPATALRNAQLRQISLTELAGTNLPAWAWFRLYSTRF